MNSFYKTSLFVLRVAMGWIMLYAGVTKVIDPSWSSAGYLKGAKTFASFFQWFLQPGVLPITDFINEWGLTLLGVSLILGIGVRLSSVLGALLMMLYYFPVLEFPKVGLHDYIVDYHVIYALVLFFLASARAGRVYGLENWCSNLPVCRNFPRLRGLLG